MPSGTLQKFLRLPALFLSALFVLIFVSLIKFPDSVMSVEAREVFQGPSSLHWLGTDSLGRDYFWRLVLGLRTSFFVAILGTLITFVVGITLGSYSAWKESKMGFLLNRIFDLIQGIPTFLFLAVIMQFYVTRGPTVVMFSLALYCGLLHWPQLARLTRSQVFKTKQEPFVEAAISLGGSPWHVLTKHLWPSAYGLWLTWFCFHVSGEIMFESTLSFLGFGIQPPQTSLGILIWEGWKYLDDKPIFLFAPAILSLLVILSFRSLLKTRAQQVPNL